MHTKTTNFGPALQPDFGTVADTVARRFADSLPRPASRPASARRDAGVSAASFLFGPSFCISLAHRTDRRTFCQRQFDTEGVPVTFFDAIVSDEAHGFPTRGAFGCFSSHLAVLELGLDTCRRLGQTHFTIFEDDVLLPSGFATIVEQSMSRLDALDWQIVYWGSENLPPVTPVDGHDPIATIAPEQTVIGKQAYTVNVSVVPELVDYLRRRAAEPAPPYSDGMYHDFRRERQLPAHTHTLAPARQGSFQSNITPGACGWLRDPLRAAKRRMQLWTR